MVDNKYIDGLSLIQRLSHVIEECGELTAALGKTARWGEMSVNPELDKRDQEENISWVLREWEDLKGAMGRYLEDYAKAEDRDGIVADYLYDIENGITIGRL